MTSTENDMDADAVSASYDFNDAGSSSDSLMDGVFGRAAEPRR